MSEPIGPGDWVECVDDSPGCYDVGVSLVSGAIYVVADTTGQFDEPSVMLEGVEREGLNLWWRASRFRHIYRPRNGAFDHLLEVHKVSEPA